MVIVSVAARHGSSQAIKHARSMRAVGGVFE